MNRKSVVFAQPGQVDFISTPVPEMDDDSVLIKTVGWQQMNRYSVMREIKRLELRIAELKDAGAPRA